MSWLKKLFGTGVRTYRTSRDQSRRGKSALFAVPGERETRMHFGVRNGQIVSTGTHRSLGHRLVRSAYKYGKQGVSQYRSYKDKKLVNGIPKRDREESVRIFGKDKLPHLVNGRWYDWAEKRPKSRRYSGRKAAYTSRRWKRRSYSGGWF